jgi:hypothetical protein
MQDDLRHLVTENCVSAANFPFARDDQAAGAALPDRFARRLSRNSAPTLVSHRPVVPLITRSRVAELVLSEDPKPYPETAKAIQSP